MIKQYLTSPRTSRHNCDRNGNQREDKSLHHQGQLLHNGNHDGVCRIFTGLSCEFLYLHKLFRL